jgi:hypothetical protein
MKVCRNNFTKKSILFISKNKILKCEICKTAFSNFMMTLMILWHRFSTLERKNLEVYEEVFISNDYQ